MIPRAHITAWRAHAPWPSNEQVEQDLVLSRALVAIFSQKTVTDRAVFRGGTALHKLFSGAARRYSEDIDLVQIEPGGIGPIIDRIQGILGETDRGGGVRPAAAGSIFFLIFPHIACSVCQHSLSLFPFFHCPAGHRSSSFCRLSPGPAPFLRFFVLSVTLGSRKPIITITTFAASSIAKVFEAL